MSKWIEVGSIDDIPVLGARVVKYADKQIAVFRNKQDEVFAINDECPHHQGFLSQGIVHNKTVTCPMHNWKINLESGEALAPDEGCTGHYAVKMDGKSISIEV